LERSWAVAPDFAELERAFLPKEVFRCIDTQAVELRAGTAMMETIEGCLPSPIRFLAGRGFVVNP